MSDVWMAALGDPSPWTVPKPLPPPVEIDGLVVRPYQKGDGPALFEAVDDQRDKLLPWMVWTTTDHLSVDDSIHYVERVRRAVAKADCLDFPLGIFDAQDRALVGGTGFHRIRPQFREAEIGYWVRGSHQGRGICTRAIGVLMSAAFRPASERGWAFRRIVIMTAAENIGSRRVCEKLGLRLEMRLRRERYKDPTGYHDCVGYAALDDEWDFTRDRAKPGITWDD